MTLKRKSPWLYKQPPRWRGLFYALAIIGIIVTGTLIVQELSKIFP
jgi:hypothetical protein